jgi:S1-C subfamily serine protease
MHPLPASIFSLLLLAPAADGWLGVYLSSEHEEAVVTEVIPDSPAADAGLKAGDVLLAVGDKEQTLVVKLAERPEQQVPATPAQPAPPAKARQGVPPKPAVEAPAKSTREPAAEGGRRGYLGLSVRETDEGVVVDRVLADSPAKGAGIQHGDVITSLGDHAVKGLADLDAFLKDAKPGRKVALGLRNDEGKRSVTVMLGERVAPRVEDEVAVAPVEQAPPVQKPAPRAVPAPKPEERVKPPRAADKEAFDVEAELAALRAELAELRRQIEALRKASGRE